MDVNLAADVLGNLVDIKPVTFTQNRAVSTKGAGGQFLADHG